MGCGTAHHPHKQIALLHLTSLCDNEAWELIKEEKDRHTSWCPSVHRFCVRRGGNLGFGSSLSSVLSWSEVKCTSMIRSDAELIHPEWLTLLRMFLSCRLTRSTREAAKFVSNAINWKPKPFRTYKVIILSRDTAPQFCWHGCSWGAPPQAKWSRVVQGPADAEHFDRTVLGGTACITNTWEISILYILSSGRGEEEWGMLRAITF